MQMEHKGIDYREHMNHYVKLSFNTCELWSLSRDIISHLQQAMDLSSLYNLSIQIWFVAVRWHRMCCIHLYTAFVWLIHSAQPNQWPFYWVNEVIKYFLRIFYLFAWFVTVCHMFQWRSWIFVATCPLLIVITLSVKFKPPAKLVLNFLFL